MAAPVMAYAAYSAISGDTYIEKLHDFALAQGWTIVEWRKSNSHWKTTPTYGWEAGTESFLDMKATGVGFGGSNLRYAFRRYTSAYGDGLVVAGVNTAGAYLTNVVSHPIIQAGTYTWGPYSAGREISMPTASMAGAWFFGNAYCIWSVIQPTSGTCILWGIGQPTLYPEYYNNIQMECCWMPNTQPSAFNSDANHAYGQMLNFPQYWTSGDAFGYTHNNGSVQTTLLEAAVRSNSDVRIDYSVIIGQNTPAASYHSFAREELEVCNNSYSSIRPGIQPSVLIKRVSPVVWQEIGTMPFCHIKTSGLAPGDILTYGAEQWLAFPNVCSSYNFGKMFRIA